MLNWLLRTKSIWIVFFFTLLCCLIDPLIKSILSFSEGGQQLLQEHQGYFIHNPKPIDLAHCIRSFFINPLIETLAFQYYIIKGFRLIYNNNTLAILLSATMFGTAHFASDVYQVITFFGGLALALAFVLFEKRKQNAYWGVVIIHGLYNVYAVIHNMI